VASKPLVSLILGLLVLRHLVLYGLSTGPRDSGLKDQGLGPRDQGPRNLQKSAPQRTHTQEQPSASGRPYSLLANLHTSRSVSRETRDKKPLFLLREEATCATARFACCWPGCS
jgi:hypothetical protein